MRFIAATLASVAMLASLLACSLNDDLGPLARDCVRDSGPDLATLPSYEERLASLAECGEEARRYYRGSCDGGGLLWIAPGGALAGIFTYYDPASGRPLALRWASDTVGSDCEPNWWPFVLECEQDEGFELIADCTWDSDGDGHRDGVDNCPVTSNPAQLDANDNLIGDACDPADTDGDGIEDSDDNCVETANADQGNGDADGLGDACDNCPEIPNTTMTGTDIDRLPQDDGDGDGLGDACDPTP